MVKGRKRKNKMKVILAMVMSADGKTTKGNNPNVYTWSSQEDQEFFSSLIKKSKVIILGRKTFFSVQPPIKISPRNLHLVITKNPKKYQKLEVPNQLEFTNNSPAKIISELNKRGYKEALLAGGENTNAPFLQAKCVDQIWITIEPLLFGAGNGIVGNEKVNIRLQLLNINRLNKRGTLLIKYKVI